MSKRTPDVNFEQHDIAAHRKTSSATYSRWDLVRRILWSLVSPAFRFSPRHFYGWRNLLLRAFGAKVGRAVRIYPSVRVFVPWQLSVGDEVTIGWNVTLYCLAPISIGARSIVSQNAHLCSGDHDLRSPELPFRNRPILIESDCWVCADAFVGPGVTLGKLAVAGARAVVMKDVATGTVVAGNPARVVGER